MKKTLIPIIAALLSMAGTALAGPLKAVAPVVPQKYFVERIGGGRVTVSALIGPGREPDLFDPSPREIAAISGADVYFRSAFAFEKTMASKLSSINPRLHFVDLNEGVALRIMEDGHEEEAGGPDPHTWLSPRIAALQAKIIAKTLSRLDPEGKAEYEKNLTALLADLEKLDRETRELLSGLKKREIFVYHPAYGYFTDAYGLAQVPVESGGHEPGAKAYGKLLDRARKAGISTVFAGPQSSGRPARAFAGELGAKLVLLDPLRADYLENMKYMAQEIRKALEDGKTP